MSVQATAIMLGVEDLARAKTFYAEGLGCAIDQDHPNFVSIDLGEGSSSLALYEREAAAQDAGVSSEGSGFRGVSFGYFSDPDGYPRRWPPPRRRLARGRVGRRRTSMKEAACPRPAAVRAGVRPAPGRRPGRSSVDGRLPLHVSSQRGSPSAGVRPSTWVDPDRRHLPREPALGERRGLDPRSDGPLRDRVGGRRARVFAAGGFTGGAWVYDGKTGAELVLYSVRTRSDTTFVNRGRDEDAAWFIESAPALSRADRRQTLGTR